MKAKSLAHLKIENARLLQQVVELQGIGRQMYASLGEIAKRLAEQQKENERLTQEVTDLRFELKSDDA